MREGIVLAGGFGRRLRAVVSDLPKPMAPVAGRPFLEILLENLAANGFARVVLSVGFMAETIVSHFGDEFSGLHITYATEHKPLGTGGAIRLAMEYCQSDPVFVFNGDTFLELDADAVEIQWRERRQPLIVACNVSDTSRYGRLLVDGKTVRGFSEKGVGGPGLINAGCYFMSKAQLSGFDLYSTFSLENDYLPVAVKESNLDFCVCTGRFIDIGVPTDYARAQIELGPG